MNILVDKDGTPRIAGLGNAYILSRSIVWESEGGTSTGRLSRSPRSGSTWREISSNATSVTHPTKAGDMLAFGFAAFEVQTGSFAWYFQFAHSRQILVGQPPFFGMTKIAATYSVLNGDRPPRPNHHEVSDLMWQMTESCWNPVTSRRMVIEEAATLLEEELSRIAVLSI